MNLFLDSTSGAGLWYDQVLQFFTSNPWIVFVAGAVIALIIMIFELAVGRPRAVEKIRSRYGSFDESIILDEIRKRDIRFLVLNIVFFVVPALVVLVMYLIDKEFVTTKYNGWVGGGFLIYYAITSVVMAIVRKDFLLLILWKIPTLTLFIKTHDTVDKGYYDVTVYSDGSATAEEHFSWATIILGILGFMLFSLKVLLIAIYLLILTIGNVLLAAVIFPIMYSVYIAKDTKAIKAVSGGGYTSSYTPRSNSSSSSSSSSSNDTQYISYDDDEPYSLD